jgi:hypothetical protein
MPGGGRAEVAFVPQGALVAVNILSFTSLNPPFRAAVIKLKLRIALEASLKPSCDARRA